MDGPPVPRTKTLVYTLSGLGASTAGIILASRVHTASAVFDFPGKTEPQKKRRECMDATQVEPGSMTPYGALPVPRMTPELLTDVTQATH